MRFAGIFTLDICGFALLRIFASIDSARKDLQALCKKYVKSAPIATKSKRRARRVRQRQDETGQKGEVKIKRQNRWNLKATFLGIMPKLNYKESK